MQNIADATGARITEKGRLRAKLGDPSVIQRDGRREAGYLNAVTMAGRDVGGAAAQ